MLNALILWGHDSFSNNKATNEAASQHADSLWGEKCSRSSLTRGWRSPVNTKIATLRSTITITCRLFCFQGSFRNFIEISTHLMENNGGDVASGKLHLDFLLWYFCQAVQQLIHFSSYLMFILSVLIVAGTTPCQHFPESTTELHRAAQRVFSFVEYCDATLLQKILH